VEQHEQWERRFKNFVMKRDMMRVARINKLIRCKEFVDSRAWQRDD